MSTVICKGIALGIAFLTCEIPDPPKTTVVGCPPLITWRSEYQDQLLKEYQTLPAGSAARTAIGQLIKTRDQIRECRKKR